MCATAAGSPEAPRVDRRGAALLLAGGAPFVAGRLLPLDGTSIDAPELACPFRAATGLPCPLCGATRAMALAAHGDGRFAHYGAVWVAVALVLLIAGAVAVVLRFLGARAAEPPRPSTRAVVTALAAVVAVAWAWALAHRETIAG